MSILAKHNEYIKDNPEGYWFKRKLYGWGWTPAKWQGWAVLGVYGILQVLILVRLGSFMSDDNTVRQVVIRMVTLSLILIAICYKTGEKPKWQWGLKK